MLQQPTCTGPPPIRTRAFLILNISYFSGPNMVNSGDFSRNISRQWLLSVENGIEPPKKSSPPDLSGIFAPQNGFRHFGVLPRFSPKKPFCIGT